MGKCPPPYNLQIDSGMMLEGSSNADLQYFDLCFQHLLPLLKLFNEQLSLQ